MTLNKSVKILGITGGIAAGKSEVSKRLKKLGAYVFDCDLIAHNVILKGSPAYDEILKTIPGDYLKSNGQIDRKALGNIVFYDKEKLAALERVVHRAVSGVIERKLPRVARSGYKFIVIDAPLLLNSDIKHMCGEIWIINAPKDVRAARLSKRNGLLKEQAMHRINIQNFEKAVNSGKYVVIDNNGHIKELYAIIRIKLKIFIKEL